MSINIQDHKESATELVKGEIGVNMTQILLANFSDLMRTQSPLEFDYTEERGQFHKKEIKLNFIPCEYGFVVEKNIIDPSTKRTEKLYFISRDTVIQLMIETKPIPAVA